MYFLYISAEVHLLSVALQLAGCGSSHLLYQEEKEELLSKNKKEIQKLSKEFDSSILDKFNVWINNEYKELKDVTFSIEDLALLGFKIKFNPIAVSISGEKLVEKGEKKESLTYNPGSNARMTTWQILAYLGLFNIIATFFKGLPIMKFMFIDVLNQPLFHRAPPGEYNHRQRGPKIPVPHPLPAVPSAV